MNREYYAYWYRLNNEESFLIWFSNKKDGFVVDKNNYIPSFRTIEELKNFASEKKLNVDTDDLNLLDLDIVENWINGDAETIEDYNPFLNSWNLFDDISRSTNGNFDNDKNATNDIYNRIFWGCNLPAVTPEGESFTPTWTKKESKIIRKTLSLGFQMLRDKIKNK